MWSSYHLLIETPTPFVLGVGVKFAPVTGFVTFVLFGRRHSGNNLYRRELTKIVRSLLALQALFLLRRRLPHARKLLREFHVLGLLLLLPSP